MKKGLVVIIVLATCLSVGSAAADLLTGLVAYYPFNGNANDESGNNRHALLINEAALSQDRFGNANRAYYFDGVNDYIQIPHPGYLANGSVNLWVNIASIPIVRKWDWINYAFFEISRNPMYGKYSGVGIGYSDFLDYELSLGFGMHPGYPVAVDTHVSMAPGANYNITVSWGAAGMKMYINGELKGTNYSYTGGVPTYTNYCHIGANTWDHFTHGTIDDVRIYNRALTDNEIRQLAAIPLPPSLLLLATGLGLLAAGRRFLL